MDKASFMLQTTRAGRLPTNAMFTDEGIARAETERAVQSAAFEHIRLVMTLGSEKKTLVEIGQPGAAPGQKAKGKNRGKAQATRAKKQQITTAQVIRRLSALITVLLIFGVVAYAVQAIMLK